ncbi:MAG: putative Ig domain-containing protein, partial [Rhodocyclales bacterium]|nr:putative Ig domain-containing protein [Rhodocyclales bacterium]
GTPDNDWINGTGYADRIDGWVGDDTIYGHEGNDMLTGGEGNDLLAGDEGDDTYIFNRGDGVDVIEDSGGYWDEHENWVSANNVLVFGDGITPAMVTALLDQNQNVTLDLGGGDSVNIGWRERPSIQRIVFSDGTQFAIENVLSGTPTANPLADRVIHQGDNFSLSVAGTAFVDFDGDSLNYIATLADGSALPAWLAFDGATGTFSGVPGNWDVASLDLTVTATDPLGQSASSGFKLDILNAND